jgi:probable phosphomutase (TIGR03848 family)
MLQTLARRGHKYRQYKLRVIVRVVAKIVLLRHAHSTANSSGILAGQVPGISLSKDGLRQAEDLIQRIGRSKFDSIRVSPMQRCEETINPWISSRFSRGLENYLIDDGLIEMNYGTWSGRKLSSLRREPLWKLIQTTPSKVKFPEGERFTAMQKRAVASVHDAVAAKKNGTHLLVSHGDVIKAIIAGLINLKLDNFQSLVIDPASISILDVDSQGARLIMFNDSKTSTEALLAAKKTPKTLLGGGAGSQRGKQK